MPRMIYGTAWKNEHTTDLVKKAVLSGFKGIDTASQPRHYSEALVGKALAELRDEAKISRADLFIQTKFTSLSGQDINKPLPYDPKAPFREQVLQSFATSQRNLQTDYIDSLVLHSPMPTHAQTMEVWRAFEELQKQGKVRQLGISNIYKLEEFKKIYQESTVKPSVVQNRFHVESGYDVDLRRFLNEHGVIYQSFWSLTANPHAVNHPAVREIAKHHGRDREQIFYKFLIQHLGICPLNGTSSEAHMKADLDIFDPTFSLSTTECQTVAKHLGL